MKVRVSFPHRVFPAPRFVTSCNSSSSSTSWSDSFQKMSKKHDGLRKKIVRFETTRSARVKKDFDSYRSDMVKLDSMFKDSFKDTMMSSDFYDYNRENDFDNSGEPFVQDDNDDGTNYHDIIDANDEFFENF